MAKYGRRLVVMVKEPNPGRVKTRLGQGIGMVPAAWWFRHQSLSLLKRVQDSRWETILAVSPDRAGLQSRIWPHHINRVGQGGGDLGDRMGRLFHSLPKGPVLIIGSDIPAVQSTHIWQAFRVLGNHDAVLGPANDGGYWLIGLKGTARRTPKLFMSVRWSTPHACSDTIASLRGQKIGIVQTLNDVDTAADL